QASCLRHSCSVCKADNRTASLLRICGGDVAGFLTMSSMMLCPHGGQVNPVSMNGRTKAAGDFILRSSDVFLVIGCPFILVLLPHPCVQVQWVVPSTSTQVISDFALTEESVGLCLAADQAPQGPVQIVFTQPRVAGR